MIKTNAMAAAKLWKCVQRHYCYSDMYDSGTKQKNQHLFDFKKMEDSDLMIDFKLPLRDPLKPKLFSL